MPIKFPCPKCKKELTVKDDMAGMLGKCPGCKGAITVPSAASISAQVAPVPKKKSVEDDDQIVSAEVVDDDVVAAEVVDDEDDAPIKKRKPRRDRDGYDDEEDDSRSRKSRARKSSRRDDDDEEEDDRPSRKLKSRSKRRDDDDDDYDDKPKKISGATRSARFARARIGMFISVIGHYIYAGVFGVAMLAAIIITIMAVSKSRGSGDAGFIKVFSYLTCLPLLVAMICNVVGSALIILTPGKKGELGLAIGTVSASGVSLFMTLFLVIEFLSDMFGGFIAWMIPFLILNPFSGLMGTEALPMRGVTVMLILLPLVEIGRMVCLSLYVWAVGKSQRDKELEKTGFTLMIAIPSTCAATGLLIWLLSLGVAKMPAAFSIIMGVNGLLLGGMLVWFARGLSLTSGTLEEAG